MQTKRSARSPIPPEKHQNPRRSPFDNIADGGSFKPPAMLGDTGNMPLIEQLRDTNGYPYTREHIGTLTIHTGVKRDRHYEVAAWWTTIALEPGTYPVYKTTWGSTQPRVSVTVPGTVVDENMPALFGGIPMTRGRNEKHIGEPTSLIIHGCEYAANPFANMTGMTYAPIVRA